MRNFEVGDLVVRRVAMKAQNYVSFIFITKIVEDCVSYIFYNDELHVESLMTVEDLAQFCAMFKASTTHFTEYLRADK